MAVLMMAMAMRVVTAMMMNDNGHDNDNDRSDHNGLTGDSRRLSLTDSSFQLCFVVLVHIPQVAAKIQRGALQCK